MGWRVLQITKPCRLSFTNNQLLCDMYNGNKLTFPIEDLNVIVCEDLRIVISNYLIYKLMRSNIIIFTCNEKHLPSGVLLPFNNHSRVAHISWMQVNMSMPLKKRLWQLIVKTKIINQSMVLNSLNSDVSFTLNNLSQEVKSGDPNNVEAYAAKIYWKALFNCFKRKNTSDIRNIALNYGYSIIRGALSRSISSYGLIPCFGIHHCNQLNAFNLADDLIEPLRPFVDLVVLNYSFNEEYELTPQIKADLINVINSICLIDGDEYQLIESIDILCSSFVSCLKNRSAIMLKLPKLNNN